MKKFILTGLLAMSASSAFAQVCEVDMVDRYNRVVRTFRAYGDANTCVEGMKQCRKDIALNPRSAGVDCVRRTYQDPFPPTNPNPYPPTNPNPYPPTNPYPQYGVSVTGLVENRLFTLTGRDASDLYINCLSQARSILQGSADDLFISANNNRFVSKYTSGWYSDSMLCSELEREVRNSYSTAYTNYNRVSGSIENYPFVFEGQDRETLLRSCIQNVGQVMRGTADDARVSLNGAPFESLYTSGWWRNSAEACKAIIQKIDNRI